MILTLIEISDSEIVEQFLPSQVSIRTASENENSDEDEESDPPPTAAEARKALHILRRVLENRGAEQEMYDNITLLLKILNV